MVTLLFLACEITPIGDTGVKSVHTGLGDTGGAQTEVSNDDNGPCPAHSGVTAVGNQWSYSYNDGNGAYGSAFREITSFSEPVSGIYEIVEERLEEITADGLPITSTSTWYWDCNGEGMWLHYVQGEITTTLNGYASTQYYDRRYGNGEWLYMARDIGLGTTWTSKVSVTRRGNGTVTAERITATAEVTEASTLVVESGTYAALEISMFSEENTVEWYSSGIGLIQSTTMELTEYSP